ncbi:MAG: Nif3-like dinuclear metal center hexameric protein [Ruminococcaceae bacterium]|nr:Nif3-like dinuclear metal center hexameric protein [Oscillospiraceae bacterium]
MATTIKDIYQYIDSLAPFETQMDFDNAGLLVGRECAYVDKVLVSLDITTPVIREAVNIGAQLIVAHHPVIFNPIKKVSDTDMTGEKVLMLAENRIGAICAHTNLDAAQGGVNELLAKRLGLTGLEHLHMDGEDREGRTYGIGRVGTWNANIPLTAKDFAEKVKQDLNAAGVRYVDAGKPVCRVAVGGGSCGSMLRDAVAAGCDTFVTADVKYDVFLSAMEQGINLLDAGHFATEDIVMRPLADLLQTAFPQVTVTKSTVHKEVFASI